MNVAIIGATDKEDRFAHRAQKLLIEHGHKTIPISPGGEAILGARGYKTVLDIDESDLPVHTATVYVNPAILAGIADEIKNLRPARIIMNPGTESADLARQFRDSGIQVVEACTLVMLDNGTF